jgi:hypothetical protein
MVPVDQPQKAGGSGTRGAEEETNPQQELTTPHFLCLQENCSIASWRAATSCTIVTLKDDP